MIVTMNNNNSDKYLQLFTESYRYLKELDKGYVDIDRDRFASLAEYYSHMADFFDNQKYKYVMLPLDEEPFNIDLNTRTINVPASFNKCASVQSDQLAETIIFTVDRYFDYMDLANTEIYVQWTIPENKKDGIEEYNGATRVEMVDLDTLKNESKIRFAWPLNDTITAHPGVVKFSVRFFRVDDSSPNKLLYSLNTVDSSIIIKPALQKNLNEESKVEKPVSDESFKKAILNSIFATEGVTPPVMPEFFAPGSNISASTNIIEIGNIKVAGLDENDTVTLYVQAFVADAGEITYKWYYQDGEGDYCDCEHYPVVAENGEVTYTTFGSVADAYIPFDPQPKERVQNERYYVKTGDNAYDLFVDDLFDENETYYEKYSSYTVPTEGHIVGNYQAAAWNNIVVPNGYSRYEGELTEEEFTNGVFYIKDETGYSIATEFNTNTVYYVTKVLTTLYPRRSDVCLLPGPSTIMFKADGDLKSGVILKFDEKDGKIKATLKMELEVDAYQPSIQYEWRKSTVAKGDVLDVDTEVFTTTTTPELEVNDVAWYSARVASTLNRETKYQFSNVCRVTESPLPPVVDKQESQSGMITKPVHKEPYTFSVSANVYNPLDIDKELLTNTVEDGKITSFDYIWQYLLVDMPDFKTIPDGMPGITGLHTNAITVDNKLEHPHATFRCLVVNNLNGERAIFDHSGTYTGGDFLGTFESKAPYIYENPEEDSYVFVALK